MKRDFVQSIKEILILQLQNLEKHNPSEVLNSEVFKDNYAEPADQASVDIEQDLLIKKIARIDCLKREIEAALVRIADGSYGICDTCAEFN